LNMADINENIDNLFRDQLESYEETPESFVWENISQQLSRRKKRKLVILVSKVAAGVALLMSLGLGYYLFNKEPSQEYAESVKGTIKTGQDKIVASADERVDLESREAITESYPEKVELQDEIIAEELQKPVRTEIIEEGYKSEAEVSPEITVAMEPDERVFYAIAEEDDEEARDVIYPVQMIYINELESQYIEDIKLTVRLRPRTVQEYQVIDDYEEEYDLEEQAEKTWENQWAVGGQMAPLYSYRHFSTDYLSNYVQDQINSNESGILAYAMGLNVSMAPAKRLSIQSGVYYSKYGQHTEVLNVTVVTPPEVSAWRADGEEEVTQEIIFSNSTGVVDAYVDEDKSKFSSAYNGGANRSQESMQLMNDLTDINTNSTATQYFEYLEIPLYIKYKLIDRRVDFNISGGFSTNFLIGNDIYVDEGNGEYKYGETINITTMNYSSSLGMGIEYPVISSFIVSVEPRFKYYLNPIDTRPSYKIHPYSFGLYTGISYVF
jgi:hypothetical protein